MSGAWAIVASIAAGVVIGAGVNWLRGRWRW